MSTPKPAINGQELLNRIQQLEEATQALRQQNLELKDHNQQLEAQIMMKEVKDLKHKKQIYYPTYECPCKEHKIQQWEFKHWTRVTEDFMYHGDYECDLEDCQHCRSDTEDDCLIHKKEENNESNSTPSKELWATTNKDSKDKEPEWEILDFEEHEEEVLRILSLMESMTQKKTCSITRAMQMEADDMH
ncbi:hypothetical protein LOZ65_006756 [Ophidiomyces ophidiicola]|nr:hypothetical protein LOZ65_006756 [Ophidiomyces ophidiicola]